MNTKRVVITGMSAITPLGLNLETSWKNLLAGVSAAGRITRFDPEGYTTTFACEVKDFDDEQYLEKKTARRLELFTRYSVAASFMALADAGWELSEEDKENTGCIIGVGLGGLKTLEDNYETLAGKGPKRINPFMIPVLIANMASGQTTISTGVRGPNYCTTSACASGLHGIAAAYTDIMLGRVDAMIAGGCESTITRLAVSGFNAMKALSTRNDAPEIASRPFDRDRDGFVMGEGAGMMILESLEHARARGANIIAEIIGYGGSSDAYHIAAPPEDGSGMSRAMLAAIREAGIAPEEVDHVNAHATSTPVGDMCEVRALKKVFGKHAYEMPVTANKSMIGHCLGGAGAIEAVFTVKSLVGGKIPMTINLDNPDPECDLDVPTSVREKDMNIALCNSFGFGGTNASLLVKKFEG